MLTLIQYEMKKTAFMKILCFSALLIAQAFVLLGGATDNYVVLGLGAGLLIFFSFLIFFILGLSSMASLSKDLNTTQGYMLFMLPKHSASSYNSAIKLFIFLWIWSFIRMLLNCFGIS